MKIQSSFTQSQVVPNLYGFPSSAEHKKFGYFDEGQYNQKVNGPHCSKYLILCSAVKKKKTHTGLEQLEGE